MATILIVDDRPENRALLVTLLGYQGHRLIEASDGAIGLQQARSMQPDLIITDILMPTMDGYEFIRELRKDPQVGKTPVMFTTAHYLDREAAALAHACGVDVILPRPCEPEVILQTVSAALQGRVIPSSADGSGGDAQFETGHLRLVSEKLRQTVDQVRALNQKMNALIDVIQRLALERDVPHLLQSFCDAARNIVGAQTATLILSTNGNETPTQLFTSGIDEKTAARFQGFRSLQGPLATLLAHPGSTRLQVASRNPMSVGLPPGHPPVTSIAAAAIVSTNRTYGWLCLANKLGFDEFDESDERLTRILGAQLGRIYENGKLYRELQKRTVELEYEVQERQQAQQRAASLLELTMALSGARDRQDILEMAQRHIALTLTCDGVFVLCRQSPEAPLHIVTEHHPPNAESLASRQLPEADQLAHLMEGGELLILGADAEEPGNVAAALLAHFAMSTLAFAPLRVHDVYCGALLAGRQAMDAGFTPEQLDLYRGIAAQVALALEASELHHRQREDAEVGSAIARVGEELIAGLDGPGLIERLGRVTNEVLQSDASWTLLREADGHFRAAAATGVSPEQLQELQLVRLPPETVAPLMEALSNDEIALVNIEAQPSAWAALPKRFGWSLAIYVPLRRGGSIIGFLAAFYRRGHEPFSPSQQRIARRLGHLASLALEAGRLIENLASANRLKSDFVATMSHELRTPMNIIMGYNALLRDHSLGSVNAEQAEALTAMNHSAHQLLELINSTLDLSRLDTGRLPLQVSRLNLAELLARLEGETASLYQKAGVAFVWNQVPPSATLSSDAVKIKMILKNLIDNAAKFTDSGTITIDAAVTSDGVELRVRDTGIGISAEELAIIFQPFRQVEPTLTRQRGGVGLGLYLVRRLVELLGGEVWVDSEPGIGSTFSVRLPNLASEPQVDSAAGARY